MKFAIPLILIASVVVIFTLTQRDASIQNSYQGPNQPTGQAVENSSEQDLEQEESAIENEVEGSEDGSFAQCLVDSGVIIYVSKTCPACKDLVNKLGGYEVVNGLFVECGQDPALCRANMQTKYVPEIQINGEVVEFQNRIDGLSKETGCILP